MTFQLKTLSVIALLAVCLTLSPPATGQATTTSTTLSSAAMCTGPQTNLQCPTTFVLASTTGVTAAGSPQGSTRKILYIDRAAYFVQTVNTTTGAVTVTRGAKGTSGTLSHLVGATVWVGPDDDSTFFNTAPNVAGGACTTTLIKTLPVIEVKTGKVWTCVPATGSTTGQWGAIRAFHVPPANCTYAPTTLTTTNVLTYLGASTVLVSQGTSNAAAGTLTLTCDIWVPSNVGTGQGALLQDITLFVGSQTTAPTSLGTSTLGTITFPAAATTETASTVTPVTAGGTVTTTSPTAITTVTTAGAFLTIKHTYSTPVRLGTDLQLLRYTMPFVQSAAAAMVIGTPGLIVHYADIGAW